LPGLRPVVSVGPSAENDPPERVVPTPDGDRRTDLEVAEGIQRVGSATADLEVAEVRPQQRKFGEAVEPPVAR
jgi:hypothetical protein